VRAAAIDTALFTAFALHHSIFARLRLKAWVSARVSPALERTTYVIAASVLFAGMLWSWRPVPGVAWRAAGAAAIGLYALQLAGVLLTAHASRQLGVFALAGLEQASGGPAAASTPGAEKPALRQTGLYGLVRHPIYLAWLLMVWPTPVMTGSRLLFAVISTAYLAIAVPFEERTLAREFGPAYAAYRKAVKWRMVPYLY
jgi:protein-S-isoprenylcysteine O-methyltransferase Ste14